MISRRGFLAASAASIGAAALPAVPSIRKTPGGIQYRFAEDLPPLDIAAVVRGKYGEQLMRWIDGQIIHGEGIA